MSAQAAGQILLGDKGIVPIRIRDGRSVLTREDPGRQFFVMDTVPVIRKDPVIPGVRRAASPACSPSGRAVVIAIDRLRHMIPRDRFLAVAFGEEMSCLFAEVPLDPPEIKYLSPQKRGTAS